MILTLRTHVLRFYRDQSGQALPIIGFMLIILMGMTGLVLDIGRLYYSYNELQSSTNAAALAGAGTLPQTAATSAATTYSGVTGNLNARNNLPNVTMVSGYPKAVCLTTLKNQGMACSSPANANAIQVKQQVTVPMYFMALLGKPSLTIGAASTASMRGASRSPYNVVIIVDTTASMGSYDSDSNCASSRLSCALQGVQVLLQNLSPCGSSLATCGTVSNSNVTNPVDKVSVFAFPGLTAATLANDYNCSGGAVQATAYTYPTLPNYQIVPFSSDYRASTTSTTLTSTSNLVHAAGGKSGCSGLQNPGGAGTYYAGIIYAAQAALVSAHVSGTQDVMILLSDGDASSSNMTSTNTNGTYPSSKQQCHQAVTAAAAATTAGTRVYSVAYGAASSGCSTDNPSITPCQTMQQIASAPQYFYSDYTASANNGSCISASQPTSSLNQIFTQIAGDLSVSRLIPNNTN